MIHLTRGQYLSPVGARRECACARLIETTYVAGTRLPRHSHEFAYMVVMIEGALRERSRGLSHDVGHGWLVFNGSGESHENEVLSARPRCLNVELSPEILGRLDDEGLRPPESVVYTRAAPAVGAIDRLYAATIDPGPELEVEESIVELLAIAWKRTGRPPRAPWIERVIELLDARFLEPPTIAQIAAEAGVTHVHLCRGFRHAVGCTIGEHVRALRAHRALGLITSDEAPLAAVAIRAGFADQAHMTRSISRALGRSPGRLRRAAARISGSRPSAVPLAQSPGRS